MSTSTKDKPASVAAWKKRIAEIQKQARRESDPAERAILQTSLTAAHDGLREAQRTAAMSPTFLTGVNLFALKEFVVDNGASAVLPARVDAGTAPHIKRCMQAGLLVPSGRGGLALTPDGRKRVADEIVDDIARLSGRTDLDARQKTKLAKLEAAIAKL